MQQIITKNDPSLDIIIGPMFAGKSSELIRRLHIYKKIGFNCLYINSNLDNRSTTHFSTHNPILTKKLDFDSIKVDNIEKFFDKIQEYDIIGIDESQLFKNLKKNVMYIVETLKKKVIISGLNGDFNRNKFGEIIDLIPFCDDITKLTPFCLLCSQNNNIIKPGLFSKRTVSSDKTILIGDDNAYIPVCRQCYIK